MNVPLLSRLFRSSWRHSIATRFSRVSIVIVAAVLLIVGAGLIWMANQSLRENTYRLQEKNADLIALLISNYVNRAVDSLNLFEATQSPGNMSSENRKSAVEQLFMNSRELFSQITYLDRNGSELIKFSQYHTYLPHELKNRVADLEYNTAFGGKTSISSVYVSPESGLLSIRIAIPVKAMQGRDVLEAEMKATRLWREVSETRTSRTGYAYLVDGQGRFVAYQDIAGVLQKHGQDMKEMPPVSDFMKDPSRFQRRIYEYKGLIGEDVIGLFEPVRGTNWAVVVELPVREANEIPNRMILYLAGLIFLAIIAAGGISFAASRRLIGPIRALTFTVQNIRRGDLNVTIAETGSPDEVGVLAREFSKMHEELRSLYSGMDRQIDELTRVESDLRTSEELFTKLINAIPDIVVRTDMEGQVQFISDYALKISGYAREEIEGRNMLEFIAPEDRQRAVEVTMRQLEEHVGPQEYHMIMKEGEKLLFEINGDVLRNEDGSPYGYVNVCRDITMRRMEEEERKKLEQQVHQARKLESVGTLAGGIAHDFNNLLMGIQGYVSLMLLGMNRSDPDYEKLKSIESQVQSGAELTRQLLGFARGGRYEVKPTDLNELIVRSAAMFGRTRKEIRIHQKFAADLWPVDVDRGQIDQVMLNLYVNAWQAMPGGGDLVLETANVCLDASYELPGGIAPGRFVKASVTDTGVGMDETTRQRIFDPFFTTKEMGRGTGLGLASAYGIIKGHAGFIDVHSEKGHGTTFNIYLPASHREIVKEEEAKAEVKQGKETILIVDDEEMITGVTRDMLEGLGYRALIAGSGPEAIEAYAANQDKIDLVILDMIMPGMGGGETFDRLKSINPEIRVVLSSGYSMNGQARAILDRGVRSFMQKPFRLDELSHKVRESLGQ
ncbi:MAG: cache domain-containing protein [Syntrophaceae bacterium]